MQKVELESVLAGVRPGGCVQPYLAGFATELLSAGYTVLSARDFMRSAAHLGRWMDSRNLGIGRLNDAAITRFARHRCECPGASRYGQRPSRRAVGRVRQFAEYLVRLGAAPPSATPSPRALPSPLIGFRAWMHCQRGIKARTIDRYEWLIERMLPALGDDPARYDASVVRQSLLRTIKPLSCSYAKTYVIALRAFLRFLAAQGRCRAHLDRAVPTVPEWKFSALPRYLEADEVERLIASCDLSKPCGVRDRAILLLLARLGLRAGDITAMRLDDLDWRAGTVRVRGKGRMEVCLPLPQDAGDAVIDYVMKVRPRIDTDRVFLCANAPVRPFATSASVSDIVRLAIQRAGIQNPPSKGAHLLRHSAATAMLRSGASLDLVATVLRHKSPDMTAYYAKVHIELLRQIAQPWPEESSC
jgi:site-specific recombinase XerD